MISAIVAHVRAYMVLLLRGIRRMSTAIVAVATSWVLLMLAMAIVAIVAVFLGRIHAGRRGGNGCIRLHLLMVGGVLSSRWALAPRGGLFRGAGA